MKRTENKFSLDELFGKLPSKFIFVCFASFEKRSTVIANKIDSNQAESVFVFRNIGTEQNEDHSKLIKSNFASSKVCEMLIDIQYPISVSHSCNELIDRIKSDTIQHLPVVIDITTFTHECLLLLLRHMQDKLLCDREIYCLYANARDYCEGASLDEIWLSKGCKDVRNVIGYPGLFLPNRKTCLILLTGFEVERATRLIKLVDPEKLLLGIGISPTHENNAVAMSYFQERFNEWISGCKTMQNCETFSFSCTDVGETIRVLQNLTESSDEYNYIIVPLNTKVSTIAVAAVAFTNQEIQVCYGIPEVYNTDNYSTPGESVRIISLHEIAQFCQ
jgi:hypothetical protein